MKDTIAFIIPDDITEQKVKTILDSYLNTVNIVIEKLTHTDIQDQAERIIKDGADIIITRGGAYHYLKPRVSVPVVNLKINNSNILHALMKAQKLQRPIVLLLEESIYYDKAFWKDFIEVDYEIMRFNHYSEIRGCIERIHLDNPNAVVIGGIITTGESKRFGHDSILIETQDDIILESFFQAIEILENIRENSKKANTLLSVIHNIEDAVLILNNEMQIEYYNDKCLDILDSPLIKNKKQLSEVSPELLSLIINASSGRKDNLVQIGLRSVSLNIIPLNVNGRIMGTVVTIKDIGEIQKLERKIRYQLSRKGLIAKYKFEDIITEDKQMLSIIDSARKIALSDSTVLIYGESGTGKEMFAQSIHSYSRRRNSPFVAINCAALSETLLESELFGYVEGAFTGARKEGKQGLFELAHTGTIFLDEINSISKSLQAKLLRVIEEKEIMRLGSDYIIPLDIRIISATNEDLPSEVEKGEFRADLFYRLNVLEIKLLPLRERKKDIPILFNYFYKRFKGYSYTIDEKMLNLLTRREWRGNIRELMNTVERFTLQESENIEVILSNNQMVSSIIEDVENGQINMRDLNARIERTIIESLENNGFNKNAIADILGISRTALWKKTKNS